MIRTFKVQNYKALRDLELELTPMHVLIGPNDTGKTSILEALAALCRSVEHPLDQAFLGSWEGPQLVWQGRSDVVSLTATASEGSVSFDYSLACGFAPTGRSPKVEKETVEYPSNPQFVDLSTHGSQVSRVCQIASLGRTAPDELTRAAHTVYDALKGVQFYRWIPRLLNLPVAQDSKRRFRMESTGFGLALCLDDILGYDRADFDELEDRFRQIFQDVKSIKLIREPAFRSPVDRAEQIPLLQQSEGKGLYFEFANRGAPVPASQVSDGMLMVLAYLTIFYLPQPPRVLLIEEPENGIHPKRLEDIRTILRDLVQGQSHTQVVFTTHSPYVVDLFPPEEVTLCKKQEDGSISAHRLSESQTVREQIDVFTLGEIWTAEGDEALAATKETGTEVNQ